MEASLQRPALCMEPTCSRTHGAPGTMTSSSPTGPSKENFSKHELGHFTAPLRTLNEVKANYGIKHIRLMKLDCEGCEWTVGLSMLHNGDWNMVDMLFGELHALCQNDVSDAAECLPRNVSTAAGRDLWLFLCEARKFPLEWGCEEPRFAGLGASDCTGSLCCGFLSRAPTASPLSLHEVRSRGSLEFGSPNLRKLRHQNLAVCLGQEAL